MIQAKPVVAVRRIVETVPRHPLVEMAPARPARIPASVEMTVVGHVVAMTTVRAENLARPVRKIVAPVWSLRLVGMANVVQERVRVIVWQTAEALVVEMDRAKRERARLPAQGTVRRHRRP